MKVLFLDQYSDLGGAQQCLLELLPAFREAGWNVILAAPGNGTLLSAAAAAGAEVESLPDMRYSAGSKSAADFARFARALPLLSRAISRLLARHTPTLLYINGPRLLLAAAWQPDRSCPIVFHSHNHLGKRYATRLAARAIARLQATVIGCCEFTTSQWRPFVPPARLHTVYNGVPVLPFRRRRARASPTVGIVGRIAPEKGQHVFVEMARLLARIHPRARFEVVGEALFQDRRAMQYRDSVMRAAQALPIQFTGWRDDLRSVYADLDLLVVPSTVPEATTRVIPEAWSAGVPVLATAAGGIAEIVRDGDNGFLVPGPEAGLFAHRASEVLSLTPEQLDPIIASAQDSYLRDFTPDRYRSAILSICLQL